MSSTVLGHGVVGTMAGVSRRVFLMRSSIVAAAASAVSAVPGLAGLLSSVDSEAPSLGGSAAELDGAAVGSADAGAPLVVHVRDVSTGEIGILNGTREVVVRDPRLVSRLINASRAGGPAG
ncbi:MAG TPA: hypothetical protein VKR22_13020 [Acidimicrobiales bacterium]|nr:hypothetical protein [Acidimicrobiales bacterium]